MFEVHLLPFFDNYILSKRIAPKKKQKFFQVGYSGLELNASSIAFCFRDAVSIQTIFNVGSK